MQTRKWHEAPAFQAMKIPIVSSAATFLGDALAYPFETLTIRIKRLHFNRPILHEIEYISLRKGYSFFYRGFNSLYYSAFLANLVYFFAYEKIGKAARHLFEFRREREVPYLLPAFVSFLSEALSLIVYVPVDCVQTRLQSGEFHYPSILSALKTIIRTEGPMRLFAGSHLYFLHNLLFTPIIFTVYENMKKNKIRAVQDRYAFYGEPLPEASQIFTMRDAIDLSLISTAIATILTSGIYTLLVRYQLTNFNKRGNRNSNTLSILMNSLRINGFASLFQGLYIRLITASVSALVYLPAYEYARREFNLEEVF